jgi:hypothetical protein
LTSLFIHLSRNRCRPQFEGGRPEGGPAAQARRPGRPIGPPDFRGWPPTFGWRAARFWSEGRPIWRLGGPGGGRAARSPLTADSTTHRSPAQRLCALDCETTNCIPPLIPPIVQREADPRGWRLVCSRVWCSRSSVPFAHRLLFWAARPPWSRARAVRAAHLHGPSDNSPTLRLRCGGMWSKCRLGNATARDHGWSAETAL